MFPPKIMNTFTLSPDRFRTDPLLHSLINGYDPRSQMDAVACKKTCQEWHIKGRLREAHFEIESFRGLVWGQQSFGILPLSHCFLLRWISAQRCSGHCFILHVREPAKRDDLILERQLLPMSHSFKRILWTLASLGRAWRQRQINFVTTTWHGFESVKIGVHCPFSSVNLKSQHTQTCPASMIRGPFG